MAGTKAKTQSGELHPGGKNAGHEGPLLILGHQWEREKPLGRSRDSQTQTQATEIPNAWENYKCMPALL